MHPVPTFTVALNEQFIEVLFPIICRIKQYGGISDRLLHAHTSDIHSTARQLIA
jgi:hypothetical protein